MYNLEDLQRLAQSLDETVRAVIKCEGIEKHLKDNGLQQEGIRIKLHLLGPKSGPCDIRGIGL